MLTSILAAVVLAAAAAPASARPVPAQGPRAFDLEAHRGGAGLTTESTLEGFQHAMQLGVTTLELDVQITKDKQAVVTHDRQVCCASCSRS
jgi:glycerophosphoryl diester phosphodiesterase